MKQYIRKISAILSVLILFSIWQVPLVTDAKGAEVSYEQHKPTSENGTKSPIQQLTRQFPITQADIQQRLDQGYTLEDIEAALHASQEAGADLDRRLNEVHPGFVNASQEAKSIVNNGNPAASSDSVLPSASMTTMTAAATSTNAGIDHVHLKPDQAPFTVHLDQETISTLSGSLSVQATDLTLPGRHGLSFALTRTYHSDASQFYDMDVDGSGNNLATEATEARRFPIGKGWSWNLPYLTTDHGKTYLHLMDRGTFAIDGTTIQGYPWLDIAFSHDPSVTVNGVASAYAVKSIHRIDQYFDADGRLIQINDAYGNAITFSYTLDPVYGEVLSTIRDAIGNTIQIAYSPSQVVLQAGNRTVTYIKTERDGQEWLSQVWDPLNRATTYDYDRMPAQFNLLGTTPAMDNPYALLTGVTYPTGAKSVYTYEAAPVTRYVADQAVNQAYRIHQREDRIFLTDGSWESKNQKTITYTGDIGSAPSVDLTFAVTVDDGRTMTTFENKKDYIDGETPPVFYNTRITRTAGELTRTTDYTYDEARRWYFPIQTTTQTTHPPTGSSSAAITAYTTYDDYGNVTAATDPNGIQTTYTYDSASHLLIGSTQPLTGTLSRVTQYTRDAATGAVTGEDIVQTGSEGQTLSHVTYDAVDAYGNVLQTTRHDTGRNVVTQYAYDAAYQHAFLTEVSSVVHDADGGSTTVRETAAYDAATGLVTQHTDGNLHTTTYRYDALGRMTQAEHPDHTTVDVRYDDGGNALYLTDETGKVSVTKWNPLGWKVEQGGQDHGRYKAKSKWGYDDDGRLIWNEDAIGNRTRFQYDAWDRQVAVTAPDGFSTATTYDDLLHTQTTTDAENNAVKETYDLLGRLTRKERIASPANVELASYTYDAVGNLLTYTDARTMTTRYAYNALGQLTAVTNANDETTSYQYDARGNMTRTTLADTTSIQKQYDERGRLIRKTDANGQTDRFYYDGNDQLTQRIDRQNQVFTFTYSNRGFLMAKTSVDETVQFTYDAAGRRQTMTDATGTTSYAYDPSTAALQQVVLPDGKMIQYGYDENGQRRRMTGPFGRNLYYGYNANRQLTSVGETPEGAEATYSYYKNGQLASIVQANGVSSDYSYQHLQLAALTQRKVDQTVLHTFHYTYDNNGNELTRTTYDVTDTFTYDPLNRIATSETDGITGTYTYNRRGDRTAFGPTPYVAEDEAGYTYDDRDRLTGVTTQGQTVTYRYNGDNLLYERTAQGETTRYYYDGDQVIAEATVVDGVPQLKTRYIRGQGLVANEDAAGDKAYYLQNGHGDVIELRDRTGNTRLNQYAYDIWGNPTVEQENIHNLFRYSGEMWDTATKLQYLRARWYDPRDGRFLNEDTFEGQIDNPLSLNLYTYVYNNPLTNVDPSGHCPLFACSEKALNKEVEIADNFCTWFGCDTFLSGLMGLGPEFVILSEPKAVVTTVEEAPGFLKGLWNNVKGWISKPARVNPGFITGDIKATNAVIDTAENANDFWKSNGYNNPPYKAGTNVIEFDLAETTKFARVSGEKSKKQGQFFMRAEDIDGLTAEEIKDKYALEYTPKYLVDVTVDAGTRIRMGVVGKIDGWGKGGGVQFDFMYNFEGEFGMPKLIRK